MECGIKGCDKPAVNTYSYSAPLKPCPYEATNAARVLLATLGLLALATSASAECAWVLWIQVGTPQGITALQLAGYARWEDCDKERVTKQQPPPGQGERTRRVLHLPAQHYGPAWGQGRQVMLGPYSVHRLHPQHLGRRGIPHGHVARWCSLHHLRPSRDARRRPLLPG
jgi:hypothetical protein